MFTGIVEAMGRIVAVSPRTIRVETGLDGLGLGDSISVNGCCLTVASMGKKGFAADLSEETLAQTSFGRLQVGDEVNLERPIEAGERLGGHIVQGHVDGVGLVRSVKGRRRSTVMWIDLPSSLRRYTVKKGSVAVDGVSLTVAGLDDQGFSTALIPHTLEATNLRQRKPGDAVNIEVDILAKYVEKLLNR
jgi:riboflavin synthase